MPESVTNELDTLGIFDKSGVPEGVDDETLDSDPSAPPGSSTERCKLQSISRPFDVAFKGSASLRHVNTIIIADKTFTTDTLIKAMDQDGFPMTRGQLSEMIDNIQKDLAYGLEHMEDQPQVLTKFSIKQYMWQRQAAIFKVTIKGQLKYKLAAIYSCECSGRTISREFTFYQDVDESYRFSVVQDIFTINYEYATEPKRTE